MSMSSKVTAEQLRAAVNYNPATGYFTAVKPRWPSMIGQRVGFSSVRNYRSIEVCGLQLLEHRAAWLWMTGEWPKNEIDHIDGNGSNNKWSNLRDATRSENSQNLGGVTSQNKSSRFLGVFRNTCSKSNPWTAAIKIKGKRYYLGNFPEEWQAAVAYLEAKDQLHPAHLRLRKKER